MEKNRCILSTVKKRKEETVPLNTQDITPKNKCAILLSQLITKSTSETLVRDPYHDRAKRDIN